MITRPGERTPIANNIKNSAIADATSLRELADDAGITDIEQAKYAQIQAVDGDMFMVTDGDTDVSSTNYGRKIADGQSYDVTERPESWENIYLVGTSVSILFSA